jgi:hypothetical protein
MFLKDDIYTSIGPSKLYHCWTDKVTKYDSSSFYNWEQDNLPIYDLDERTEFLWGKAGYPTSSIPGVALVVSADAPDSVIACNKNIFRTLSGAIEALPNVINFPIVIEVASFGKLGDLNLEGFKFGGAGSLEIINRNFSHSEAQVSSLTNLNGLFPPYTPIYNDTDGTNIYKYVSGTSLQATSLYDTSSFKVGPLVGFREASCLSISAPVFSSTYDARLSGIASFSSKLNGYAQYVKTESNYSRGNLIIDDYDTINPYSKGYDSVLTWKSFDLSPQAIIDHEINTKDASTINDFNGQRVYLYNNSLLVGKAHNAFNGVFYGNKLNKILIKNCNGKVFIRNFFVDGESFSRTNNLNGVEVNNSADVVLENIVAVRFRKAGFKFNNSKVILSRSVIAERNYNFNSSNSRITDDFSSLKNYASYNQLSSALNLDDAAGLVADNSVVTVSCPDKFLEPLYASSLGSQNRMIIPLSFMINFSKNANGVVLNNSTLQGGKSQDLNETVYTDFETTFDIAHNVQAGLICNNSKVSLNGVIRFIENLNGCELNNSIFEVEKLKCIANQNFGIKANRSNILYNKNFTKFFIGAFLADVYTSPMFFNSNGQSLNLNNSTFEPYITSAIENNYASIVFDTPIRSAFQNTSILEQVKISNNSKVTLISPQVSRAASISMTNDYANRGKKGSEIYVSENSKLKIIGTKNYCSKFVGPNVYNLSQGLAAVCADKNSSVEINGPTVMMKFGIDLLADNNSKITIGPLRSSDDSTLDVSTLDLREVGNHTAVELHSVRACIVVNNNSILEMKNLGSVNKNWTRSGNSTELASVDYIPFQDYELYTSGGSIQFYPNPIALPSQKLYSTIIGEEDPTDPATASFNTSLANTRGQYYLKDLTTNSLDFSSVTLGGVCVKAVNNSIVDVKDVNFPAGFWNPSAPYYDGTVAFNSGGACYKTFIWNICDTSQLKASLLSVSGLYPSAAAYVGPYGYWTSGGSTIAAYGLPSSTPDTSSLSVLDYYGANPSSTAYSVSSAQNYGPFRIYFSVNPFVNTLVNVSGQGYGINSQIYSQGYQPSSNLVCSGSVSSLYMQSLQRNSSNNIVPSGYYYGKDMVNGPYTYRAILDESAANTFANAKHCAVGKSNNAKVVSIYYPYDDVGTGDSAALKGIGSLNLFDMETDN